MHLACSFRCRGRWDPQLCGGEANAYVRSLEQGRATSHGSISRIALCGAEIRFSCCEAVFVDQSIEPMSTLDMVRSWRADRSERGLLRIGRREVKRAVRPAAVVVVDEDAKRAFEVPSVEDEEPVEALRADGADEALSPKDVNYTG
jgi:hypothetical protein